VSWVSTHRLPGSCARPELHSRATVRIRYKAVCQAETVRPGRVAAVSTLSQVRDAAELRVWNEEEKEMKRRMPTREEIEQKATELYMQRSYGISDILPEREELAEEGLLQEAQRHLMSSTPAEVIGVGVTDPETKSQMESYVMDMASELDLTVRPTKEYEQERKQMAKRAAAFRGFRWQIRGLRHLLTGKVQHIPDVSRRPSKPKPKKPATKKGLLQKIRAAQKTKGMAHIEKDLGLKTDFHGVVIDTKARNILGSLLRKGDIYTPRESYLKITEPQPKIKRVSLRKPLDIGAAIRGKPIVALKPEKRVPKAPEKVMLPKKRPKKRKKARVERAGKTMRALRKVDGVKVFSFPDHVWGVRNAKKKKKK
jgi:hypothetical protein